MKDKIEPEFDMITFHQDGFEFNRSVEQLISNFFDCRKNPSDYIPEALAFYGKPPFDSLVGIPVHLKKHCCLILEMTRVTCRCLYLDLLDSTQTSSRRSLPHDGTIDTYEDLFYSAWMWMFMLYESEKYMNVSTE